MDHLAVARDEGRHTGEPGLVDQRAHRLLEGVQTLCGESDGFRMGDLRTRKAGGEDAREGRDEGAEAWQHSGYLIHRPPVARTCSVRVDSEALACSAHAILMA